MRLRSRRFLRSGRAGYLDWLCVGNRVVAAAGCVAWCSCFVGGFCSCSRLPARSRFMSRVGVAVFVIAAALIIGFGYAAWRAETRLQRVLPVAFEDRNIELTGFVRGLPLQDADGTRFLFEVESNEAALPNFPRVVQLSWLAWTDHNAVLPRRRRPLFGPVNDGR